MRATNVLEEVLRIFAVRQRYYATYAKFFKLDASQPPAPIFVVNALHRDYTLSGWCFTPWMTEAIVLSRK